MEDNEFIEISDQEIQGILEYLKSRPVQDPLLVFFDDTGAIKTVTNQKSESDLPFIEIVDDELRNKLSDQSSFFKFKVVYDPEQKKNVLIEDNLDFEEVTRVEDLIMQFPVVGCETDEDIVIIQDITKNIWTVKLGQKLLDEYRGKPLNFDFYNLFITDFNDPNILHRTITVPFKKLVDEGFFNVGFDNLLEKNKLSVFSRKHFKKHGHILNEN